MSQLIAIDFVHEFTIFDAFNLTICVAVLICAIVARNWRFAIQWFDEIRGNDWGQVSAVIDVVSVTPMTEQTRYGERTIAYVATLTYFYRNPELQMGEYSRKFGALSHDEAEAQTWANSYKGRSVMVHVDPRDPTHSVLRKQNL